MFWGVGEGVSFPKPNANRSACFVGAREPEPGVRLDRTEAAPELTPASRVWLDFAAGVVLLAGLRGGMGSVGEAENAVNPGVDA